MSDKKPLLVGESNPYGSDPKYALYPAPDGCSGHRLCCLILGMRRRDYIASFDRVNLCDGKWSIGDARMKALSLWSNPGRFILLGSKVCKAWETPFIPFSVIDGGTCLVLPHPSGLCRIWNEPDAIARARDAVAQFAPELKPLLASSYAGEPA